MATQKEWILVIFAPIDIVVEFEPCAPDVNYSCGNISVLYWEQKFLKLHWNVHILKFNYNFKSSLTSLWTRKNAKPKEKYGRLIIVIDELFVKHTLRYFTVFTNWYVFKYVYFFKQ